MASTPLRTFTYRLLFLSLTILLLSPLWMYFSHDVHELKEFYPHIRMNKKGVEYELQEKRPDYWVKLKLISPYAKWAIVLSEDWSFYHHEGIDLAQIKAALMDMLKGERFRGASTITQQMVKNIFLTEDRTLWRKLHEMILAQKVERVLTKDRILEIYLNSIEFGPGVYGIRKASYHYFRKHPSALGPKEAAFLAMLLPSPKKYYISYRKKQLTPFARSRVNAILKKMKMGKVISTEQLQLNQNSRLAWEK